MKLSNLGWTLRRYAFRPDVVRKVKGRYRQYRRRAERDAFDDVAFVTHRTGSPAVVIDVGANIGLLTSRLLKRFPHATVHAFEPTPATSEILRERLGGNTRVVINELALTASVGTATFHVDNRTHGGGSNSLLQHSPNFRTRARTDRYQPVTVSTTSLDAYTDARGIDHVDLLKLDIEGAELLALEGATQLLQREAVDFIVSEVRFVADYEGQPLLADLIEHLGAYGYTVFSLYTPAESGARQALWADATFVSPRMRRRMQQTFGERACGWSEDADH
jgi:FkbM family methyltransferase